MEAFWSSEIDRVLKVGYPLNEVGVDNWALKRPEALKALEELLELEVPVLGGDVYEEIEGSIRPNYDSWHCDKLPKESNHEFVVRSIGQARSYIQKYNVNDYKKVLFVLVPSV